MPTLQHGHRKSSRESGFEAPVVLNADDFGRSPEINAAVVQAHRAGVLTSASLMITGEAAAEAVSLAREMPSLSVGLHVVLVDGRSALPPSAIPRLVDAQGLFCRRPFQAGLRHALLGREGRAQLRRELEAQLERFAETGLPLAHVDGHCHLHVHPVVFRELAPLAERHGAGCFRLPQDDLRLALRHAPLTAWSRLPSALILGSLSRRCGRWLRRHSTLVPRRAQGQVLSGNMRLAYVADLLRGRGGSVQEIYFHPTLGPRLDPAGPNPNDLDTLLSPAARAALKPQGVQSPGYPASNL